MKRSIEARGGAAWGSLCVLALSSACHVIVEKGDGEGGQPAGSQSSSGGTAPGSGGVESSGGSNASGGSPASSGGQAAAGGAGTTSGGAASSGAQSSAGVGAAGAGAMPEPPYEEACGVAEAGNNDERAGAVDLAPGATICLESPGDHDWFYIDTPNDGKAHVIQLDLSQEPNVWFTVRLFAKKDGSDMGSTRLDKGVTGSLYATAGPGARTLFDFTPFVAAEGRLTIKASVTAENDSYEPNNDRDSAAAIQAGQDISAQMMVPYVADTEQAYADWYKVDLAAGKHVFKLVSVPETLYVDVHLSDSARVAVASGRAPNRGATFQFSFEVGEAGSYVFSLTDFNSVPVLMSGTKPRFLSEQYQFRID